MHRRTKRIVIIDWFDKLPAVNGF